MAFFASSFPGSVCSRRRFLQAAGAASALACTASLAAADQPVATADKLPLQLGLASYSLRKFNLDQTIAMAQQLGLINLCLKSFHLPLDSTPEQIGAAVAKIRKAGLNLYGCGVVNMNKEAEVRQAFEYAKMAGMQRIIASPTADLLPLVNEMVQKYDICLAIHNHGPTDKKWPTPDAVLPKITALDKRVGLCNDIGHTVRAGADLIAVTEKCADRLMEIHMKDVSAATAKAKEVVIGHGVIDIPRFLQTLIKIRFAGVVAFEHEPEPQNPLPGLTESVAYVKRALASL